MRLSEVETDVSSCFVVTNRQTYRCHVTLRSVARCSLQVYLPCVLQTKKRYVGFMYETPEQTEPTYHAKGTETVRRDSCPVVSKVS